MSKLTLVASLLVLSLTGVRADQIDNETNEALKGTRAEAIMVKVNPETKSIEAFKVTTAEAKSLEAGLNSSSSAVKAEAMAKLSKLAEVESNKVAELNPNASELDKDSSTPAWHCRWWGGYRWNNWGYYNTYYYGYNSCWNTPYATPGYWGYGGYSYYYRYNYRYNNCYYGWYY